MNTKVTTTEGIAHICKNSCEKVRAYVEDVLDRKAIERTDFRKGRNFEVLAKELNMYI